MNDASTQLTVSTPYGQCLREIFNTENADVIMANTLSFPTISGDLLSANSGDRVRNVLINDIGNPAITIVGTSLCWTELKNIQAKEYMPNDARNVWYSLEAVASQDDIINTSDNEEIEAQHDLFDLTPENKINMIKKIVNFKNLEKGWDSYNAKEITSHAVDKAIDLFNKIYNYSYACDILVKDVFPYPLANGGVQIDIDAENIEIEIEISPDPYGKITYLVEWLGKNRFKQFQEGAMTSLGEVLNYLKVESKIENQ